MWRRLGFPEVGAHRRLVTAVGIDALGSGLWLPLSVLYFLGTTDVPVARVGLALSVAAVLAMPFTLVAGRLVDRLGARRTLQAGNLLQAAGFAAYVVADRAVLIALVVTVTAVGRTLFWGAYAPMVATVSDPGERESWFGFLNALRNIGFAVGGLAASAALTLHSEATLHAVALLDAASYVVSGWLMTSLPAARPAGPPGPADAATRSGGPWRSVAAEPGYLVLVGANAGYALSTMALTVLLPAYAVGRLGLPGWVPGAIYVLNTVLVGLGQGLVVAALTGVARWRAVALSAALFGSAFLALLLVGWVPAPAVAVALVLAATVVYTLGEMTGGPVLSTLAAEAPPAHLRGRYQAAFQLSWSLAGAVAPVLFLSLLGAGRWQVWTVLVAVVALGALCCLALRRRMPLARRPVARAAVAVG